LDEKATQRLNGLLSIPGVGPITALTLLALVRKYPDANRSQIVALAGFDPIQIQSGTSVHGKSRITIERDASGCARRRCLLRATTRVSARSTEG